MKQDTKTLIASKATLLAGAVDIEKIMGAKQVTKSAPAVSPVDTGTAFKPFENAISDVKGLSLMLDDLVLVERSLFRGKDGLISYKARDFTTSSIISLFEQIEKIGLEPTIEKRQMEFLKDLTAHLKSLPVVKVTLAFAPTNTFIEKISSAVSGFLGKKALLDIVVNEYIVGGAVFEYAGRVSRQTLDVQLEGALGKHI